MAIWTNEEWIDLLAWWFEHLKWRQDEPLEDIEVLEQYNLGVAPKLAAEAILKARHEKRGYVRQPTDAEYAAKCAQQAKTKKQTPKQKLLEKLKK